MTGLEDAIARAHRYAAAGADVIFVDAPRSEDELRAIGSAGIGKPLLVNVSEYGRTPDLGARGLRGARLLDRAVSRPRRCSPPSQSTKELAASLRENGSTRAIVPRMMPFDELNETLGKDEWDVIP